MYTVNCQPHMVFILFNLEILINVQDMHLLNTFTWNMTYFCEPQVLAEEEPMDVLLLCHWSRHHNFCRYYRNFKLFLKLVKTIWKAIFFPSGLDRIWSSAIKELYNQWGHWLVAGDICVQCVVCQVQNNQSRDHDRSEQETTLVSSFLPNQTYPKVCWHM